MKTILISATALLMAGAIKVNAQTTDTTIVKTTDTTVTSSTVSNNQSMSSPSYSSTGSSDKGGVRVGVKAGANLSNIIQDIDDNTTNGSKIGFVGGLFLELPIVKGFSIQPEVLYSQKGNKAEGTYLGTAYKYKLTSNFIDIPLLAKFKPSENFAIVVGPQFSFLTSTKRKYTVANTSYEQIKDADNDNVRKNILGGVVGIEAGAGPVVFDLRYNLDLQSNNGDGTSSTPKYKNQVISLTAGIRF
jgi:hypothetical protein